jgi:glucokinase
VKALGIDVGGTSTRVALFTADPESGLTLIARTEMPTNKQDAAEAILSGIRKLSESGHAVDVGACGIGLPEYVRDGDVTSSMVVEFSSAGRAAIERELSASGATPALRVDSDVRCAALAEWHAAGDPELSLLYFSIGTGISSAFVLPRGDLLQGARGAAISLGEWPAPPSTLDAHTVQRNLEQFASGQAIERRYLRATGRSLSTRQIAAGAAEGTVADTILREAGAALGDAARRLHAVLDPSRIVIGGGLGSARTPLWEELESAALKPIPERSPVDIRQASLGPHSGELGAALLALRGHG